jgi:hypothetical protein
LVAPAWRVVNQCRARSIVRQLAAKKELRR